jgi:hypothetical protein
MSCERACEIYNKISNKLPEELRTTLENWVVGCESGYCEWQKGCCWFEPEIVPLFLGSWSLKGTLEELNITHEELVEYLSQYKNIYVCIKNDYRYYEAEKLCKYVVTTPPRNVHFKYGLYINNGKVYFVRFA